MNSPKERVIKTIIDSFESPREEFDKIIKSETNLE